MQKTITEQDIKTGNATIRQVDDVSNSMHHAIDRASNAAGPAIDSLAESAHQATNRMAMTATQAADTLQTASNRFRVAQNQVAQSCSGYVREKPLTSLGIAAASGFLFGMVLCMTKKTPRRQ